MERRIRHLIEGFRRRSKKFQLRIPKTLLIFGFIALATFIMGGGIYDLLDNPVSVLPGPSGGWIAVHPLMNEQTLNESILSMTFYIFIFSGFILSYRSSQIRFNPRQSKMMMAIGLTLLIIGVIAANYLLVLKGQLS
jgi:hypothetical protein